MAAKKSKKRKSGKRRCKFGFKKGTRTCRKTRAPRKGARGRRFKLPSTGHRAGKGQFKVICGGKQMTATDSWSRALEAIKYAKKRTHGACSIKGRRGPAVAFHGLFRRRRRRR